MASSTCSDDKVDPLVQKHAPAGIPEALTTKKKKKKKVLIAVPEYDVRSVLSYKDEPVDLEVPDYLIRENPKQAAVMFMIKANLAMYNEHTKARMLEEQRDFKHQLKTKGRVTYELEVDEDDPRFKDESTTSSAGAGRRRHRPGVMKKQDGQIKRLN
ncbi:hypothetical protein ZWY2020_054364 [Hordeum vulgare]|nr:hypothetical protein ZWY2020_054364 [Hordeum vulgare]